MDEWLRLVGDYIWFIGVPLIFLLLALYVFRPSARRKYQKNAEIPFREDDRKR